MLQTSPILLCKAGITLAMIVLFGGCATQILTERQLGDLHAVSVAPPSVTEGAYHAPSAKQSPGMANAIPIATGGGLIPALLGAAIDASVTSSQQKKFEASNACHFAEIETLMPADLPQQVHTVVHDTLAADPFFGSRLGSEGTHRFTIEIQSYGLVKAADTVNDDITLVFHIDAVIKLLDNKGAVLMTELLSVTTPDACTLGEYAADADKLRAACTACVTRLGRHFQLRLNRMLGRKMY